MTTDTLLAPEHHLDLDSGHLTRPPTPTRPRSEDSAPTGSRAAARQTAAGSPQGEDGNRPINADVPSAPAPSEGIVVPPLGGSDSPAAAPGPPKEGQRNALKILDRVRLMDWMKLPENTEYVIKHTDAEAAYKATTDLNGAATFDTPLITITPANLTGIRITLGITKPKPEKPTPTAPAESSPDLIELQRRLDALGRENQNIRIEANTTREAFNLLVQHVQHCEALLRAQCRGEINISLESALNSLPPLTPLPLPLDKQPSTTAIAA